MPAQRSQLAFLGSLPELVVRKVHVIVQFDEEYPRSKQYTCPRCQTRWVILDEPEHTAATRSCPHCFKTSRTS